MAKARRDERRTEKAERDDVDVKRADPVEMSSEERLAILRGEAMDNVLPNPPKIPGMHLVWLSTMNQYTPIQSYIRLGYRPVRHEEVAGMEDLKIHSGEMAGFVSINEMVLYCIPEEGYQQIMKEMHHDRPNREAEKLLANVEQIKDAVGFDSDGRSLVQPASGEKDDGFEEVLDRRARVGTFE